MKTFRLLSGCIGLLLLSPARVFSQATITQILSNGPPANCINIVFLSEGYTAAQLGQFTNDAKVFLNYLQSEPPFDAYQNYFNGYAISVASVESGADHPLSGIYRNTYFNSTFYSYGIERLLTIPPNNLDGNYADGAGKVYALLQTLMPEYDLVSVIVNDPEYGGSGGEILITSMNSDSAEIAAHELGHTFAGLGDEYSDAYPGWVPYEMPNVTQQTNRALIKWAAWILDSTPIPTPDTSPYASVVGLFEGAEYQTNGWYRPQHLCEMRALGYPFCKVCAETLVKAIYTRIRPIASNAPATNASTTLANSQSATFSVATLRPTTFNLNVQWFTNNAACSGATNSYFTVSTTTLPFGSNQVRVEVTDTNPVVRTDPGQLLKDSRSWQVQILSPRLEYQRLPGVIVLSWTTNAQGFVLEYKTNLNPLISWQPAGVPTVASNRYTFSDSIGSNAKYYRLRD
ncbi:MAG TPA: M64 family metallopeptidase [Candidatus Limnocylindrales bacterium]|nr:M64 family metallopeptidase [Candidatus Limnocylindrales bacterium]